MRIEGIPASTGYAEGPLFDLDRPPAAYMTGIELELATVLDVTGRLFDEAQALDLADRIKPDLGIRLARRLITRETLLGVNSRDKMRSRLRRDAFRWIQRLARPRPYRA